MGILIYLYEKSAMIFMIIYFFHHESHIFYVLFTKNVFFLFPHEHVKV